MFYFYLQIQISIKNVIFNHFSLIVYNLSWTYNVQNSY